MDSAVTATPLSSQIVYNLALSLFLVLRYSHGLVMACVPSLKSCPHHLSIAPPLRSLSPLLFLFPDSPTG